MSWRGSRLGLGVHRDLPHLGGDLGDPHEGVFMLEEFHYFLQVTDHLCSLLSCFSYGLGRDVGASFDESGQLRRFRSLQVRWS